MLMPILPDFAAKSKYDLIKDAVLRFNTDIPRLSREYPIKLIVVPDIHSLIKEPRNRNGMYISRLEQIIDELCCIIVANGISGVIFTGDIADSGASSSQLEDEVRRILMIIKIVQCADNNGYSVFGNHERTYSKNNPFYTIASIDCDSLQQEVFGLRTPGLIYPFIRTPAMLDYGVVRIFFMHFRKNSQDKLYKVTDARPNNIVIYHDDLITFESKMELYHHKLGHGINVQSTDIFQNVDWAILGHIHTPLLTFNLLNHRRTVVDCPGSLMPRTVAEKHEQVRIPVICMDDVGWYREYLPFNIGEFKETVDEERVAEERNKRALTTLLKKDIALIGEVFDYEDLLANVRNTNVREIITKAKKPLEPKSIKLYDDWRIKATGKAIVEESLDEIEEDKVEII